MLSIPKGVVVVEGEKVQLLHNYKTEHRLQTLSVCVGGSRRAPVDT